jgi:hypothetical protein
MDEALRRFREGKTQSAELRGGAGSRDSLVVAFIRALERRDTAALRPLVLDAAEFAWHYYPSSPLARPPYQLPPDILWLQLQGQSERGASLLLSERSDAPLGYLDHRCGSERAEGENRLYGHCLVRRLTASGDTVAEPLFGLILERGGTFKFVSYANKLD